VLQAILESHQNAADESYGEDAVTEIAIDLIKEAFGTDCSVFFVSNCTAANRLALATLLPFPFHAVIGTTTAHANVHECGALESLGHKLLAVPPTTTGKFDCAAASEHLNHNEGVHRVAPRVLSISNATEVGTVCSAAELHDAALFARAHKLRLHMDGARLSNALAHSGISSQNIGGLSGASTITLGATKNGGLLGDAVIVRNPKLQEIAARLHKQHGQLCARTSAIAAQFIALLTDGLWLKNARQANTMASLLARRCQEELDLSPMYPVESNAVFVNLPEATIAKLLKDVHFYIWDRKQWTVRWMCSWDTTEDDVDELVKLVKKNLG
jgi:threonine aldolase